MECVFAEECPEIELKSGMVFITSKQGDRKVAMSPATLQAFIRRANRTLQDWRIDQSGNVEDIGHWRAHAASS